MFNWKKMDITERKEAQEQLQASEAKFRNIFDNSRDGLILADLESRRFLMCNKSICKMLGYTEDELKRLGVKDIHLEKDLPYAIEQFGRLAKEEIIFIPDLPVKRKDGSIFYAEVVGSLIISAGKKYLLGSFRDITELKKAEEKIKIFSRAVENAYDSFVLADINGNVIYVNESAIKTFGYSLEEILKLNVSQFTAVSEDANKIVGGIKNKGKWSGEIISIRKNKEKFPVLMSNSVIKDDKDNPAGMMGIFRDITELKRVQEEIEKARAYSEGLISSMVDGLWVIDIEGKTIDVNPAVVKMLGYENRAELLKKNPTDATSKKDLETTGRLVKESLEGRPCSGEIGLIRKDGKEIPISISATAMKDSQGKTIGGFAVLRDITELKKAQEEAIKAAESEKKKAEELVAMNEELESTNEELRQANEELESTTEELRAANEEAQKAKETAEKRAAELERFNKVAVDRELKMRELKEKIAELEKKLKAIGA